MTSPMNGGPKPPEKCQDMREVRAGVDETDREIAGLLARRFAYMRAAARIKTERGAVRDEDRKAQVIAQVARLAREHELPEEDIVQIWDALVECSIRYEMAEWERLRS